MDVRPEKTDQRPPKNPDKLGSGLEYDLISKTRR